MVVEAQEDGIQICRVVMLSRLHFSRIFNELFSVNHLQSTEWLQSFQIQPPSSI